MRPEVRGACEMLGLDPLYVANEGKLIAVVPPRRRRACWPRCALTRWGECARSSARWSPTRCGMVVMRSLVGGERVVTMLAGEQLPRIC